MTATQRYTVVKENKHCFNCLRKHDLNGKCKFGKCKFCQKNHNSLLHRTKDSDQTNKNST